MGTVNKKRPIPGEKKETAKLIDKAQMVADDLKRLDEMLKPAVNEKE
jgi:hypothetical protein